VLNEGSHSAFVYALISINGRQKGDDNSLDSLRCVLHFVPFVYLTVSRFAVVVQVFAKANERYVVRRYRDYRVSPGGDGGLIIEAE
jgi:hypothetical protein